MTPRLEQPSPTEPAQPAQPSFAWPPKQSNPGEPALAPALPTPPPSPTQSIIDSIETHLLGRTGLAFDLWAQRNNWQRDTQEAYCWRCGSSIGEHETDGEGCATCRAKSLPWTRSIRLGTYQDTLRDEILTLKFRAWRPTGVGLGKHLGLGIAEQLELAQIRPSHALLVPVPTHPLRRIARGVDHTLVIARGASISSTCRVCPLLRARHRPEQVGLSMTARAQNIQGAFFLNQRRLRRLTRSKPPLPRVLILIDDVRTTGATFVAASKALKAGLKHTIKSQTPNAPPPEIWTACLGVAGESRRKATGAHAYAQRE